MMTVSLKLTRENIIRTLRDKHSGAHYDARVTDPLTAAAFLYTIPDGTKQPVRWAVENTMRQIAEELRAVVRYLRPRYDPTFKSLG